MRRNRWAIARRLTLDCQRKGSASCHSIGSLLWDLSRSSHLFDCHFLFPIHHSQYNNTQEATILAGTSPYVLTYIHIFDLVFCLIVWFSLFTCVYLSFIFLQTCWSSFCWFCSWVKGASTSVLGWSNSWLKVSLHPHSPSRRQWHSTNQGDATSRDYFWKLFLVPRTSSWLACDVDGRSNVCSVLS